MFRSSQRECSGGLRSLRVPNRSSSYGRRAQPARRTLEPAASERRANACCSFRWRGALRPCVILPCGATVRTGSGKTRPDRFREPLVPMTRLLQQRHPTIVQSRPPTPPVLPADSPCRCDSGPLHFPMPSRGPPSKIVYNLLPALRRRCRSADGVDYYAIRSPGVVGPFVIGSTVGVGPPSSTSVELRRQTLQRLGGHDLDGPSGLAPPGPPMPASLPAALIDRPPPRSCFRSLIAQAGAPASKTSTLRYQHDLDTRETQTRTPGRSPADLAAALRARNWRQQDGELDPKYQKLLDRVLKAKEQQPRGRPNRRAGRSSQREKRPDYSLPQIVVVQESASGRRVGAL